MINSNYAPLRDIRLNQHLSVLEVDASWSLNVKSNCAIALPIYGFLLSNIRPKSVPLLDIKLRNPSNLKFDLQGHSRSNVMAPRDSP